MEQNLQMQTYAWVASGMLPFANKTLPPEFRVREYRLHFRLTGTKGSSETLAVDQFPLAIANIRLDSDWVDIDIGGFELSQLVENHMGKLLGQYTAVGAGAATFVLDFDLMVPVWDPTAIRADDSAMPVRLMADKSLQVSMAPAGIFGGTIVITAGTIYCESYGVHDTADEPQVRAPEPRVLRMLDPGGQTIPLEPGIYHDFFLCFANGCDLTAAGLTHATCVMDGYEVVSRLLSEQLIANWNILSCWDVHNSGLVWPDSRLPIIAPSRVNGQITKRPYATKTGAVVTIYGTLATPHCVYWLTKFKDSGKIAQAIRAYGHSDEEIANYRPDTAKGKPLESAPGSKSGGRKFYAIAGKVDNPAQVARRAVGPLEALKRAGVGGPK